MTSDMQAANRDLQDEFEKAELHADVETFVWANHGLAFGHLMRSTHVLVSLNVPRMQAS